MAATVAHSSLDSHFEADKLTYEIFSVLENKFLFGYSDSKQQQQEVSKKIIPLELMKSGKHVTGKVRILSIDGGGSTDGILAAKSLVHLESHLRKITKNPNARIVNYFDVVAGAGTGGVLAALLFTAGKDGGPMFSSEEALEFVVNNRRKISRSPAAGLLRMVFRRRGDLFGRTFGELTLRDTLKAVLVPCYDLKTSGPFVFSRADALEMDGCDFKMKDVCAATSSVGSVGVRSSDGKAKIVAVGGDVAMNNPTAAAITHVLNNKQEFPFCNGVEDLLVVSLGNGEACSGTSTPTNFIKIAGEGVSDLVDQAVSLAFGESQTSDYVRIQANGIVGAKHGISKGDNKNILAVVDEMLRTKNVESVLFKGKKLVDITNLNKLESFARELVKEQQRRKTSILPTVVLKQASGSPRTSSATTLSMTSSN